MHSSAGRLRADGMMGEVKMSDRPLFILEMANNHMGEVQHGVALIEAMG